MPRVKGSKRSPEERQKHRETLRRKIANDPEFAARMSANLAKGRAAPRPAPIGNKSERSAETREKLRQATLGSKRSPESLAKQSESMKTRWADPAYRAKTVAALTVADNPRSKGRKAPPEERAARSKQMVQRWAETPEDVRAGISGKIAKARARQILPLRATKPELAVRAHLDALGVRYVAQSWIAAIGHHQWDLRLVDTRILIEVDGCYWHACPEHIPKSRREPRAEQVERDRENDAKARGSGWRVERIWEHEVADGTFRDRLATMLPVIEQEKE